jgi:hypothetical protein
MEKKINGDMTGRTVLRMTIPMFSSLALSPPDNHQIVTTDIPSRLPIVITHIRLASRIMSSSKHNGNIPSAHQHELLSCSPAMQYRLPKRSNPHP